MFSTRHRLASHASGNSCLSHCRLLACRRLSEGLLFLFEVFESHVDHIPRQFVYAHILSRLLLIFSQVAISHFEHLVDESLNLLCDLAVDNQGICSYYANLEECAKVRLLHLV